MSNLNKVFLMGRLTRDPEQRFITSGQAVTNLGIAVNGQGLGAQQLSSTQLQVTVPPGLFAPGTYDLNIGGPNANGGGLVIPNAVTIN